jgi:outer membrane lipoprotein-sorting protein
MKKILILLLILVLVPAMLMTGCGGAESASEDDQSESGQSEQSEEASEAVDGMGDLLSAAYVDMMEDNEYLMSYKATMDFEGQSMEMEATVAAAGDDMAMTSSGEGFESTIIIKGDKIHMVDHGSKTVTSWAQTQDQMDSMETGTFDAEGITYIGNGEEDGLIFEEYSTLDGSVKYYFQGKELVKIAVTSEGQTMMMEIIELSDDVPASMFEIPAGYQQFEM